MKKAIILFTAIFGISMSAAFAAPITWEIQDLILGPDRSAVTGQFTYDAVTNKIFDVDIRSGAGRTTTCNAGDCTDRLVAGVADGYVFNSTPFGYAAEFGAFSFFDEADRSPDGEPVAGAPILLLFVGAAPADYGTVALIGFGALEFLHHTPSEPFRPIDPHRWAPLGSSASIASVPEPGSIAALGLGIFMLFGRRSSRKALLHKLRR